MTEADLVSSASAIEQACTTIQFSQVAACKPYLTNPIAGLDILIALVLALALTYSNLPNFRYSHRIVALVRITIDTFGLSVDDIKVNWHGAAKQNPQAAWLAHKLRKLHEEPYKIEKVDIDSSGKSLFGEHLKFAKFFASDLIDDSSISIDKYVSAASFSIGLCYLLYIVWVRTGVESVHLFWFVLAALVAPFVFWSWKKLKTIHDFWNGIRYFLLLAIVFFVFSYVAFEKVRIIANSIGFLNLSSPVCGLFLMVGTTASLVFLSIYSYIQFPLVENIIVSNVKTLQFRTADNAKTAPTKK